MTTTSTDTRRVPCVCGPGMMIPGTTECDFCSFGIDKQARDITRANARQNDYWQRVGGHPAPGEIDSE